MVRRIRKNCAASRKQRSGKEDSPLTHLCLIHNVVIGGPLALGIGYPVDIPRSESSRPVRQGASHVTLLYSQRRR